MVEAASVLNVANELDEIQLIRFVKAGQGGAVDIQNADDMPILMNWHNNLALRCTVAGNVTGEGVYIADTLNRARLRRCSAYAASNRDARTGGKPAERGKRQRTVIH